jgi:carbamoylphosphate synthase large subunit
MKIPAVISVGAGKSQIALIKSIRDLGYKVVSVDRNPGAAGFKYSNECLTLSTYDGGPIIEALECLKASYDIKGVFTRSSGPPVITTAVLAEHYGLPGATVKAASIVVDKNKLMQVCLDRGISIPRSRRIDESNILEVIRSRLPCVIKPTMGLVGKAGVTLVKSIVEAGPALQAAEAASFTNDVLVEEYVPGNDIGLMSVVFKGRVYPVVLLRELNEFKADGKLLSNGLRMPYSLGEETDELIYKLAQSVVDATGIEFSPFLMSCRCKEGGPPTLIEVHLDFGGDGIVDKLFPMSTDFDFIRYVLEVMLHVRSPVIEENPRFKYSRIGKDLSDKGSRWISA